jgi:hypothetical protein
MEHSINRFYMLRGIFSICAIDKTQASIETGDIYIWEAGRLRGWTPWDEQVE